MKLPANLANIILRALILITEEGALEGQVAVPDLFPYIRRRKNHTSGDVLIFLLTNYP
jgi:hypothetical protein